MDTLRMKYPSWAADSLSLCVIIAVCIIVNVPYFLEDYYPVHDTLSVFQVFSYYYSELFLKREFPWWLPLTSFGMPIDSHILFSFGPFQYLAMAVGYITGINNTLHLFSASLAFDSLLLGLGSFLLCQHILKDRLSSLVCVVSILLLTLYDRQIYWNFKLLVPLPLVLYLAQRGIEKLNPAYLLWSAAILLCWAFGSITYTIVVQIYIVAMYCIVFGISTLAFSQRSQSSLAKLWLRLTCQMKRREVILLSLAAILVIAVCLMMMYSIRTVMSKYMEYNALGRGADLSVDLKSYLTYGGNGGTEKILELFNGLPTSHPHDYLVYIGLVNFGFVFVGLMSMRKIPSQIALTLTAAVVIAFTLLATGVAELAYSLPGMSLTRHIAYFITVGKLLLLILAGFGVKACLSDGGRLRYVLLISAGALCLWYTPFDKDNLYSMHVVATAAIFIAFVGVAWVFKMPVRTLVLGCVFISLMDMASYRIVVFKMADLFLVAFPSEFKTVQSATYRPTRLEESDASVLKRYRIKPMDIYGGGDSYLREDFCKGSRQDMVAPGVKQLLQLRVWRDRTMTEPRDALDTHGDQALKRVLGCGVPKLRMVGNVRYARSEQMAAQIVCCQSDIYERPVIITPELEEIGEHLTDVSDGHVINVKEFSSNMLRMLVHNKEAVPLWLIYADAFDDRWKVMVDGVSRPLYRANIAFKAFKVEPGLHEITLSLPRPLMDVFFTVFWLIMSSVAASVIGIAAWCIAKGCSAPIPTTA